MGQGCLAKEPPTLYRINVEFSKFAAKECKIKDCGCLDWWCACGKVKTITTQFIEEFDKINLMCIYLFIPGEDNVVPLTFFPL